jgi:hypothetical protein
MKPDPHSFSALAIFRRSCLTVILPLVFLSGCNLLRDPYAKYPTVLPPEPTLEQVTGAVNQNSRAVQSLMTDNAKLSGSQFPTSLDCTVAYRRENQLRVTGGTPLTGQEFDFGSNPELFWLWIKRNQQKATYFCRHEEYRHCPTHEVLPLNPNWLQSALGLVMFSPHERHEGPFRTDDNRWIVRSRMPTPQGEYVKITTIHPRTACVLRQDIYDARQRALAHIDIKEHHRDAVNDLVISQVVDLKMPTAGVELTLQLGSPTINPPTGIASSSFEMPLFSGYDLVNVCDPNLCPAPNGASPGVYQSPGPSEIQLANPPTGSSLY